jgi:hypothetical protein
MGHNTHSTENKAIISFKNSFWLVIIIVGLFVSALNFVQAQKEGHGSHGAHGGHEAAHGGHEAAGHGAATHGHKATEGHEAAPAAEKHEAAPAAEGHGAAEHH